MEQRHQTHGNANQGHLGWTDSVGSRDLCVWPYLLFPPKTKVMSRGRYSIRWRASVENAFHFGHGR